MFTSRALRIGTVASALAIALTFATAPAGAGVDSVSSVRDGHDRTIEAVQSDTRVNFVAPLDGNPLTREWFHSGEAGFVVSGPDAEQWSGHVTVGYQIGYPATLDGRIKFEWSTPSLGLEFGGDGGTLKLDGLIPRAGIEVTAGFGPGIREVEVAGADVSGANGVLRLSGFHGTVTGVLGQTNVRPFVKVVGATGDTVVTYGPTFSN
ncbi:MspA family porin [Nocardia camponoti]|uniref:MspA family porin n=1 Tax=Nocardia camponoti TaxID=1616106 RepID=UPI001E3FD4EB|nr:MspA family porin [Nocardia camponoti]